MFCDERALLLADPDHSDEEDRFIVLGLSTRLRLPVVCHSYRRGDETIRIISARKATKPETAVYANRWTQRENNMISPRQPGIPMRRG